MPLKQLSYKGYRGERVTLPVEEMLQRAADDPWSPVPYPVLKSMVELEMLSTARDFGPNVLSCTDILGACVSCTVLKKYIDYEESIEDLMIRHAGTWMHNLIESYAQDGDVTELRFFAKVPGTDAIITGKPDIIRPFSPHCGGGVIIDIKTTSSVPQWDRNWDDHVEQLQIYRWMVNNNITDFGWRQEQRRFNMSGELEFPDQAIKTELKDVEFHSLGNWYIETVKPFKLKPLEIRKVVEVPTKKGAKNPTRKEKEADVWTDKQVEDLIIPKYAKLKAAFDRWENDGTLIPYSTGFDWLTGFPHAYSPVARECIQRHFNQGR